MRLVLSWLVVALAGLALPAAAAPIAVETGEHDGFTRIVLRPSAPVDWQLGRHADGYELRVAGADVAFSTDGAYRKIGRSRLADLAVTSSGRGLSLTLACDCHARAFSMKSGVIVIDVTDGPAPGNGPFEKPLAADGAAAPTQMPEDATSAPVASAGSASAFSGSQAQPLAPAVAYANLPPPPPTQGDLPVAGLPSPFAPENFRSRTDRSIPPPNAPPTGAAGGPLTAAHEPAASAASPPVAAPATFDAAPTVSALPGSPLPNLPTATAQAAEADLFRQLSRAASQGFVELANPPPTTAARAGRTATEHPPATEPDPPPVEDPVAGFRIETSLDRDTPARLAASAVTAAGNACPTDDRLALSTWSDGRPPADQIADARAALVGEFDRAEPEGIGRLARLYLAFGMGAEARQMVQSFPVEVPDARLLADMGRIMEDEPVPASSPLNGLRDCETAVALWAFLAAPDSASVKFVDTSAVVRAFSALPLPVRSLLARRLALRLTDVGAAEAARAVRNALARDQTADPRLVSLMDAERTLTAVPGQPASASSAQEAARADLEEVAQGSDPLADAALLRFADEANLRHEPMGDSDFTALAALTTERRGTPEGRSLGRALGLALALRGDFDGAYARLKMGGAGEPDSGTIAALARILADKGDDPTVLRFGLATPSPFGALAPASSERSALARRMSDAGFPAAGLAFLGEGGKQTSAGRLIAAAAALQDGDGPSALASLDEIGADASPSDRQAAARLRARVLIATGDVGQAAPILQALGDSEGAAAADWQAGNWAEAAASSSRLKEAVDGLGLAGASPSAGAGDEAVTLATSKALIDDSARARTALGQLLGLDGASTTSATTPAPSTAAPKPAGP